MSETSRDNRTARIRTASRHVVDFLEDAIKTGLRRVRANWRIDYLADALARAVDKEIVTNEQRQQIIDLEAEYLEAEYLADDPNPRSELGS